MTIELHINDKTVKLWNIEYSAGPFPMKELAMKIKILQLEKRILECKVDVAPMICENPYEIYVVYRSAMKPENIDPDKYAEFLITVAKNKQKIK